MCVMFLCYVGSFIIKSVTRTQILISAQRLCFVHVDVRRCAA